MFAELRGHILSFCRPNLTEPQQKLDNKTFLCLHLKKMTFLVIVLFSKHTDKNLLSHNLLPG